MDLTVGGSLICTLDIADREYRISRVEGVPQRTVTPPPEQLERIRHEREKVRAAKSASECAAVWHTKKRKRQETRGCT